MSKTREIKSNVRFLIKSILFIILALLLCSANIAAQETHLNIRQAGDITSLDPANLTDTTSQQIAELIYMVLLKQKPNSSELEPALAHSWEISDDGKTYTFHLRDDVYWHRGFGQVTAKDVAYSFERIRDGLGAASGSRYRSGFELVEEFEGRDRNMARTALDEEFPIHTLSIV